VSIKLPIIDAPYSLAAKTPPAARVAPKMEYVKFGTSNMGIPRHKQTIALIINNVFNFIAMLLSLKNFKIVILTICFHFDYQNINSSSKLRQQKVKVNFI
jgi:hypothetical protein